MSALNTFLSGENLKHNYQFLLQRVEQRTGINPRKYPDFEKQFGAMAQVFANKMVSNGAAEHELQNLATMNNKLIDHAANFFCDKIQSKRVGTNAGSGFGTNAGSGFGTNAGSGFGDGAVRGNTSARTAAQDGRVAGSYFNSEQGFTMLESNDDVSGAYSQLVSDRNAALNKNARATFDMPVSVASRTAGQADITPLAKQLKNLMLERSQVNGVNTTGATGPSDVGGHPGVGLLPFNIDDEVSHLLMHDPGSDLPLYQNIMDLQSTASVSERVKALEAERQSSLFGNASTAQEPTGFLSGVQDSFELNRRTEKRGEQSVELTQQNTRAQTFNQQSELKNPADLYRLSSAGEQRLVTNMTEGTIGTNDVRALAQPFSDNQLIERLLAMQRDIQPKYAERTNYIIVNSLDRDWFNTDETRYRFRVNFRPHSSYTGAGIQDLYKNITSVELVNALIPQDCVNIPFDTRVYIDILNFPYLLLQIQEFSDVFRGTNSHNDRAFSVLVYDKQHDSSVLSLDYISGSNTIVQSYPKTQFYREYRKTFYKYTPAYFEKKVFFNQPLASLPRMTINLTTPAGENLYTDSDVLKIVTVNTVNLSTVSAGFEYTKAVGYPGDNQAAYNNRQYIRIQTESAFSNKMFRLGDLIRIQGFDCDATLSDSNAKFNEFMNRESGHYILNTDYCNVTGPTTTATVNQGYTSNLYIAPPGELNATNTGVDPSTYYSNLVLSNPWVQTDSKLINVNLQTHMLFKINTREADISPLNKAINV
jgi:hypothetical protein